jgi:hypothetical protein
MSDEPKPNRDLLKLAVLLLTTILASGGVQRWRCADTEVKVTGNRNAADANEYDLKYALRDIEDLRERVKRIEARLP